MIPHAILAFDPTVAIIAFAAISFVSWIINQVNQAKPPQGRARGQRPQRAPRPRNDRVQQEIDQFLQEATGRRQKKQEVLSSDEIEIVDRPRAARRPPPKRRPPPRPAPQAAKPKPSRPGQNIASRHLAGQEQLGAGVSQHIESHMAPRVSTQAAQHLPHSVDASVSEHLGAFTADDLTATGTKGQAATTSNQQTAASMLLASLRQPGGVRNAIIMQEILRPPKSLR